VPTTERCDGIDNDCDEEVDEVGDALVVMPLVVQGFNADLIAEAGPASSSTTAGVGLGGGDKYVFCSDSFANPSLAFALPASGDLVVDGRTFHVGPYAGNNVARVKQTDPAHLLTFPAHTWARRISLLVVSTNAGDGGRIAATLHYSDGTSSPEAVFSVNDWSLPPPEGTFFTRLCAVERPNDPQFGYIAATVIEIDVGGCKSVSDVSLEVSPSNAGQSQLTVGVLAASAAR
jgi:hypothetical protein